MFHKEHDAWLFKGDFVFADPRDAPGKLDNVGAPAEVWRFFGLEPPSQTTG